MSPIPSTSTPLGYGVSAPSNLSAPSPILADNINPETHDYTSLLVGLDPVDSQVYMALSIRRDSGAAVVGIGNRFHTVRKMGNDAKNEIEALVREALSTLIKNRDIDYRGTDFNVFDMSTQSTEIIVKWVNLRAFDGKVRTRTLQLT